jgi:hypothetical protein
LRRMILVLTGITIVAAMMGLSALSSVAQSLDTGDYQYEDNGSLDTGDDGALDTGDTSTSPAAPQCGWYYNTAQSWNPWWEYWCWWPGWGWEFVFWVWA